MCENCLADMPSYVAGFLSDDRRMSVEAHLAGCSGCRAACAEWQAVSAAVGASAAARLPAVPPYWYPELSLPSAPAAGSSAPATSVRSPIASRPATESATALRRRIAVMAIVVLAGLMAATLTLREGGHYDELRSPGTRQAIGRNAPAPEASATAVRRAGSQPPATVTAAPIVGSELAAIPQERTAMPGSPDPGSPPMQPANQAASNLVPAPAPGGLPTPTALLVPERPVTPPPVDTPEPDEPDEPDPPTEGRIVGVVRGPDGLPRAEIRIVAERMDGSGATALADSGPTGAYTLTLPAGEWLLRASAVPYRPIWFSDRPNPFFADPIAVAVNREVGADFGLEISPPGSVEGQVIDGTGSPVAGAIVLAARPFEPVSSLGDALAVVADSDGRFVLRVAWGSYAIGAARASRDSAVGWWSAQGNGDAAPVEVTENAAPPWLVVVLP